MIILHHRCYFRYPNYSQSIRRFYSSRIVKSPYRVLFCGTDHESAAALKALHAEQEKNRDFITSIDVVCKTAKPFGRGRKILLDSPVKQLARSLGLPLHEIPTFTGWKPPTHGQNGSVIIAVAFGLKVPLRLLKGAEYGGLNVHPSLLPDLRGAAPLHHTILRGDTVTGVTVQSLDPHRFDHGKIWSQEKLDIPNQGRCTTAMLNSVTEKLGIQLLLDVLKRDDFRAGNSVQETGPAPVDAPNLMHATKVGLEHAKIDWLKDSHLDVLRKQRAMSEVWSSHVFKNGQESTITWHELHPFHMTPSDELREAIRSHRNEKAPLMLLINQAGKNEAGAPLISAKSISREFLGEATFTDLKIPIDGKDTDEIISMKLEEKVITGKELASKRVAIECADGHFLIPAGVTLAAGRKWVNPHEILPQKL